MKASDVFIRQLHEEGVDLVFGVPGEENLDLLESIRASHAINFVTCRHEQAAAFMAATMGRIRRKVGVCLSTLGPGATNLVTGITHAELCGFPMIAITGQKPVLGNFQGRFQLVDVVDMMRPLTKSAVSILNPRQIPSIVHDAVRTAETYRQGVAHVELPEDIADAEVPNTVKVHKGWKQQHTPPDAHAVEEAVELLRRAKHPVVIVASNANTLDVSEALTKFIDQTQIPVTSTQMAKGVLAEDHSSSLFTAGIHKKDYIHYGLERSDLLFTIGYDIAEHPPALLNPDGRTSILHIDYAPARSDECYNPVCEMTGDIRLSLELLLQKLPNYRVDPMEGLKLQQFLREHLHDKDSDPRFPPIPQRIVADTRAALGRNDIICLDNGIYKVWYARNYPAYAPHTVLLDNCLATMGAGLPMSIAVKLAYPERNVVAICGDGGFMMNSQEVETAVRLGLDLTILILNDNAYGFVKWKQKSVGLPNFAMDLRNPDFVKYIEAYGGKGYRVQKTEDLRPLLLQSFQERGVKLIECPIDYSENERVFGQELKNLVYPA